MKYLRIAAIVALFCALFCAAPASHAVGFDFHATVLDPVCFETPDATCTLIPGDPGTPFPITLNALTCADQHVTGLPTDGTPFGCFAGVNDTGFPLTSIDISFNGALLPGGNCDTNPPGLAAGAFAISSCNPPTPGDPDFELSFSGGSIGRTQTFILVEIGVDPTDFQGTGIVNVTPEPNSLLLLSTGVMMAGLYLTKRQRAFVFLKK